MATPIRRKKLAMLKAALRSPPQHFFDHEHDRVNNRRSYKRRGNSTSWDAESEESDSDGSESEDYGSEDSEGSAGSDAMSDSSSKSSDADDSEDSDDDDSEDDSESMDSSPGLSRTRTRARERRFKLIKEEWEDSIAFAAWKAEKIQSKPTNF